MNCDFMSILYSKPLRKYKKPTFKIGDRVQIPKYDLSFRKGYKAQFTREILQFSNCNKKTTNIHKKYEQYENIQGKFYQKGLIKVI